MIEQKLEGLYFFMFSTGSYSDYCPGQMYACDHEVFDAEWHDYYKEFQNSLDAKRAELVTATFKEYQKFNAQHREYAVWRTAQQEPEDTFVALHNMVPVGVTEMWRD